jgi:hypothetical protein
VGPTTKLVFWGLEIDSVKQVVAVPIEKLGPIVEKIKNAVQSEKITLRQLQSLVGSLSFLCRAVPPGRAFLRRLIDMQRGVKQPWYKIRLTAGAKADLRMWAIFLKHFNGSAIFMDQSWLSDQDVQLFTDSSGAIGFGGFLDTDWFQGKWPQHVSKHSIAWLELFPIVVAIVLWGNRLKGKRIILRCDNEAVVCIINKQTSKCPLIMKLLRFFVLQCLKNNLAFSARHVPGKENNVADALSRFQMERFRQAAPNAKEKGLPVPEFLWNL